MHARTLLSHQPARDGGAQPEIGGRIASERSRLYQGGAPIGYWARRALRDQVRLSARRPHDIGDCADWGGQPLAGARTGRHAYQMEFLEPRILLAGDVFLNSDTDDYLGNPTLVGGTAAQLESLILESFELLDEIEGAIDIPSELDIDLPGLLDREPVGDDGNDESDHEQTELDKLLDIAGQLSATDAFDSVGVGDIDFDNIDLFDFGDAGFGLTDLLRNAFQESINGIIADGVTWASVITDLNGLSATIDLDDPFFFGGEADYVLDMTAGGFALVQDSGNEYDLTFDFGFAISRTDAFSFDLGRGADLLGFAYGADAEGDGGLPDVELETLFSFDTTVQIDLSIIEGDFDADTDADDLSVSFTNGSDIGLRDTSASAGASADVTLSSFDLRIGFLDIEADGTFELDAAGTYDHAALTSLDDLPGVNPALSDITFDGDVTAVLTITADFDGAPSELDDLLDTFSTVSATVTLTADPFNDAFHAEGGSDPRTSLSISFDSDFETYFQPFVNVTPSSLLTYLAQFRSFVLQFQNAPDLFGFDLPFADGLSLLGDSTDALDDLLDWATPVQDLINGLFNEVDGASIPTFDSIQDLAGQAAFQDVLGSFLPDLVIDGDNTLLQFGFAFENATQFTKDLNFNFNFGRLDDFGLGADAQMVVDGDLDLSFLFGIDLGGASEVSIMASGTALALTSLYSAAGSNVNTTLSQDARFRLKVNGIPGIDVTVDAGNYTDVVDLADAIQTAIDSALDDAIDDGVFPAAARPVFTVSGDNNSERITIAAPAHTLLTIEEIDGDYELLGFAESQVGTVSRVPSNGILSDTATFTLTVDGTAHTISIADTDYDDNTTAADLLADLQGAIDTAFGANIVDVVAATDGNGGFRLVLADDSAVSIAVNGVNDTAAAELGLRNDGLASRIQLLGDREMSFAFTPQTLPSDGQLSSDLTLEVTIDGVTYDQVTVEVGDTDGTTGIANDSPEDLLTDIRKALQTVEVSDGVTLAEFFELDVNSSGELVVSSFFRPADSITIDEIGSTILSTEGEIIGTLSTGVGVDGQFTATNVVTFDVEVTLDDASTVTRTYTLDETGFGSLADLVADFNTQVGGGHAGLIAAGLDNGRLVLAATDSTVRSVRVTGLSNNESSDTGFESGASATENPASGFFVADVAFAASVSAAASGSGTVNLGFLGIDFDDISGGVSASVSGALTGTTVLGVDDALSFNTLFDAASGVASLVDPAISVLEEIAASIVVTGDADIDISDISVRGAGVFGDILTQIDDFIDTLPGTPTVNLSIGDITDFDPTELLLPTLSDFGEIGDFLDFEFGDIKQLFAKAENFLAGLMNLDFLGTPLPFVGLDLSEALGIVDSFGDMVDDLTSQSVGTVQQLTDAVAAAMEKLGSIAPDLGLTFDVNSPAVLGFDLGFDRSFSGVLPINFSLTDLGIPAAFEDIANLSGSANLAAEFGAAIGLSFGIDITDPLNGLVINTDETGIELTGFAEASNVSFLAGLGPLTALIDGGAISLGGIGPDNTIFGFDLSEIGDSTINIIDLIAGGGAAFSALIGDIKDTFDDVGTDVFNFNFDTVLPIFVQFGGASNFIGNLSFEALVDSFEDLGFFFGDTVPDINDIFQNLQLPNFEILTALFGPDFLDNLGLLDTVMLFVEGLDLAFGTLGDLFTGELFGLDGIGDIPLIGDALKSAGGFFDDIRNDLIAPLANLLDETPEFLANIFGQILGLIDESIGDLFDGVGGFAFQFVDEAGDLLGTLRTSDLDGNFDPTGFLDADGGDLINTFEDLIAQAHGFELLFPLGDQFSIGVGDVDFGIPAFGLEVDGELTVGFIWSLFLGMGVNKNDGFFLSVHETEPEISLEAFLSLPDETSLTLGFLKATADNQNVGPGFDPFDDPTANDLYGMFAFDISTADADGRLGFADIPTADFDVDYGVGVDIDLGLVFGFGGIIPAGTASAFPTLLAEIGFEWGIGDTSFISATGLPDMPEISFDRLGLQLGSFLTDLLDPVVGFVQEFIEPILPLINLLVDPIPVISDLDGDVSLLDIAAMFGYVDQGLVNAIEIIVGIANDLADLEVVGEEITLWIVDNTGATPDALAGFSLGGDGAGAADLTNPGNANLFQDPSKTFSEILALVPDLGEIADFIGDDLFSGLLDDAVGGATSGAFDLLNGGGSSGGAGLVFPFLDDPTQIFGLLFQRDADLIGLDLPKLMFGFSYNQFFSIWGPIGVELGGAFSAEFDFDVAFDTAGVRKFAAGGFDNPLDLFEGFYFLDDSFENRGVDTPEITLSGQITAALAISIGVASAGVGGGVFGSFLVDWADPNRDLKMRLSEIAAIVDRTSNIFCIFDYSVKLEASMFVFVEALFGLWRKEWQFGPSLPLIDETIMCDIPPILATPDPDSGILRLNMGEFAEDRKFDSGGNVPLEDLAEEFYVFEQGGDIWVEAIINGETIAAQNYGSVGQYDLVLGRAGLFDDKIFMDGSRISGGPSGVVTIAGDLQGGQGDDELVGGSAADLILGDAGDDLLKGGAGADLIRGGTGNDRIKGEAGNDVLFGELGNDTIDGGAGDDTIDGGEGDDVLAGGDDDDTIWGRAGIDIISGGGGSDIISGGLGNDLIWGDLDFMFDADCLLVLDGDGLPTMQAPSSADGDDFIAAGGGTDWVSADGGNDFVWGDSDFRAEADGVTIADFVSFVVDDTGEGATGQIVVDALVPQTLLPPLNSGGGDIISGGGGDDVLIGQDANDILRGDLFDDLAVLLPTDRFSAGLTSDKAGRAINAAAGNEGDDVLIGNAGADVMFGNAGDDWAFGGAGTDFIIGGAGDDHLRGATGRDVIFGDDGVIEIFQSGDTDRVTQDGDPVGPGNPYNALTFDPYRLATANPGTGGDDNILGGVDDDIVFGGNGADEIDGQGGRELIFGDHGEAQFTYEKSIGISLMTLAFTTDPGEGGVDTIKGGLGEDIVFGGTAGDIIDGDLFDDGTVPQSNDAIIGDFGEMTRIISLALFKAFVAEITTESGAFSGVIDDPAAGDYGNDVITGGGGADVIFGGLGEDTLQGGRSGTGDGETRDIIVGDDGWLSYVKLSTDLLTTVDGNQLFGDGDHLPHLDPNNAPGDVPLQLTLDIVETLVNIAAGDADVISGGPGDDIILGGGAGDTIYGDDSFDLNTLEVIPTSQADSGDDTIVGDQGLVALTHALVRVVRTTADLDSEGGGDTVFGNFGDDVIMGGVSNGATDTLGGGEGDDIILGDEGVVLYTWDDEFAIRDRIFTTRFDLGGADVIRGNAGNDVGIGGSGADTIQGDNVDLTVENDYGNDLLIGDQGELDYVTDLSGSDPVAHLRVIFSTDTADADGGIDTIEGDAGDDIIIGGVHGDFLYGEAQTLAAIANSSYDDVILGDEGRVFFLVDEDDGLTGPDGDPVPEDIDPTTIDVVETTDFGLGGNDTISGGRGNDIAMGGTGADLIFGDNLPGTDPGLSLETQFGDDVLIGDQGQVINFLGVLHTVDTTDTAAADGDADTIYGNDGNDVILGGVGADLLHGEAEFSNLVNPAGSFDDIILGDEGTVIYDPAAGYRVLVQITTKRPDLGAGDVIFGNRGSDIALGGTGDDTIHGDIYSAEDLLAPVDNPDGEDLKDLLVGDHGRLDYIGGELDVLMTIDTDQGGEDVITGDDDDDIILGGAFGDRLYGENTAAGLTAGLIAAGRAGDDIVLGDNGRLDWGLDVVVIGLSGTPADTNPGAEIDRSVLDRIKVIAPTHGGSDVIFGNGADDLLVGGTAGDLMWGDSGDGIVPNDGNPIDLGSEGGEDGPDGADVMFGDHAAIYPTLARAAAVGTTVAFNDFAFSIFTQFAHAGGDDMMFGNGADDMMLGQQGDDVMFGGTGDDDMIGGHNVAGGIDEQDGTLTAADYDLGPTLADMSPIDVDDLNDVMDGGVGDDSMAGDNAVMFRLGDNTSPRFRMVGEGGQMYEILTEDFAGITDDGSVISIDETIAANVGADAQASPDHVSGRYVEILDHTKTIQDDAAASPGDPHVFGNDVMVGGFDDDEMWGQLGDDIMQGDGLLELYNTVFGNVGDYDPTQGADPSFDLPADYLAIATDETTSWFLTFRVVEAGEDGDDYMEGNGGNDRMYGNLGSDDMIGGSSSLFGLGGISSIVDANRPDGADLMYGAAGDASRLERNADAGDDSGFDSDVMVGDNANIYRLVDGSGEYRHFEYDESQTHMIIPRPVDMLDYGYEVNFDPSDPNNPVFEMVDGFSVEGFGAGDLMYGEAGDDFMYGQTGDDVMFGNAQNDSMHGGRGNDIMFGGTGEDGILGDDGLLRMSRVPEHGGFQGNNALPSQMYEPLWGIDRELIVNQEISTPGNIQRAIINVEGELRYEADLLAFRTGTDASAMEFNDIIFGGLDTDWLHGGDGDDAISGAEALAFYYSAEGTDAVFGGGVLNNDFSAVNEALQSQQQGSELVGGDTYPVQKAPFWFDIALYNPGDILRHEGKIAASEGGNANFTNVTAEFAAYDSFNPRDRVFVDVVTGLSVPIADLDDHPNPENVIEFILNFSADEGVLEADRANGFPDPDGTDLWNDGDDRIFGDLGNDWMVGGTGRDHMYGGRGNDLLNMDDDHDTNGMLNDDPDAFQAYADIVYGGAGRDVMILNTGADRAIDWVGEFNSYIVPFSPFGAFHISRSLQPHLAEYLLDLSESDGADRTAPDLGLYLVHKTLDTRTDDPDPDRNFEPFGELGMVRQQDFDWGEQTGAPSDPQAGNLQGKREIMRRALFADEPLQGQQNNGSVQGFAPEAGTWTVQNGVYNADPGILGAEGVSIFFLPDQQPSYMEILASINVDKDKAGWNSNGYIIFDYQSEDDFKFAGINGKTNKIEIGQRTADGWTVLAQSNLLVKPGKNFDVTLVMHGTVATAYVNGANPTSYNFQDELNDGYIGLGVDGAQTRFDNWQVQKLPPVITFEYLDEFEADGDMGGLEAQGGIWSVSDGALTGSSDSGFAFATRHVPVELWTMLEVEATIDSDAFSGVVFDYISPTNFKFAAIDPAAGQVVIGHVTSKGMTIDATADVSLDGSDHVLKVNMLGGGVSVELDGKAVVGHVYYSIVNDGSVGVFAKDGSATFDSVAVRGDDPAYLDEAEAMSAATSADPDRFVAADELLTSAQLERIVTAALQIWARELGTSVESLGISVDDFTIADLSGDTLALERDGTIYIDADGAGYGYFIDETPHDDDEFDGRTAPDGIDLLSVVLHEIGHSLGYDHDIAGTGSVMDPMLAESERHGFESDDTGFASNDSGFVLETDDEDHGHGRSIDWAARTFDAGQRRDVDNGSNGRPDFLYELDDLTGLAHIEKPLGAA